MVSTQGTPSLFILSQIFTYGSSTYTDLSILEMDYVQAALYMIYNTLWVTTVYPYALIIHMPFFWPLYLIQLFLMLFGVDLDNYFWLKSRDIIFKVIINIGLKIS